MIVDMVLARRVCVALLASMIPLTALMSPIVAQEVGGGEPSEQVKDPADDLDLAESAVKEDPYALPEDADADELFAFIDRVKSNRGQKLESVVKAAKAATAAAAAIRELDGLSTEVELKALQEQLAALEFLQRFDPPSRDSFQQLIDALQDDSRPEFRRIGLLQGFKSKINTARTASEDRQRELISEYDRIVGDSDFDRDAYSLGSALASAISYSPTAQVAASLYEDMAARMSESSDEALRQRAPKMLGAARRISLPGNKMEIVATTTTGEPFDWDSYRGKVVLVDFWASWCGPCRAEIPNMKRNLELYGDKGFAIVGVNLDHTLEACENYVDEEELTWTNLMSQKSDERGWDNPLATYYGITGIPTAILVDQEGKVVSLKARGRELDRLLVEILGEVEPQPSAPDADGLDDDNLESDDQDNANR